MVSAEKTVTRQTQTDVHSVLTLVKREWKSSNAWKIRTEEEVRIGIHTLDTKTDAPKGTSRASRNAATKKNVTDVKIFASIAESAASDAKMGVAAY